MCFGPQHIFRVRAEVTPWPSWVSSLWVAKLNSSFSFIFLHFLHNQTQQLLHFEWQRSRVRLEEYIREQEQQHKALWDYFWWPSHIHDLVWRTVESSSSKVDCGDSKTSQPTNSIKDKRSHWFNFNLIMEINMTSLQDGNLYKTFSLLNGYFKFRQKKLTLQINLYF
jgi:hypothetical protein